MKRESSVVNNSDLDVSSANDEGSEIADRSNQISCCHSNYYCRMCAHQMHTLIRIL